MAAFRHRFTLRQTRRTVPIMFSIELVQASDPPQLCRELQTIDSQHLVETFENAGGNAGRLLVEPAGEIAQQPLGLVGIVELPGLAQRPADRGMQRLGQPLDHIAGLMELAPLDWRVGAEGAADWLCSAAWRRR
jgi:hypothetical protein